MPITILKENAAFFFKEESLTNFLKKIKTTGFTIVPIKMFLNENGFAKIEIALARGKKMADKREDIKQRDSKRELARMKKINN
jgi:SsrA-binding protein